MSDAHPATPWSPLEPEPIEITPPTGDADEDELRPASRPFGLRRVVLGALLALGVATVGVFGTTAWHVMREKNAALATPDQVAGLSRDDREAAASIADYLRNALAAKVDLSESIGAVYADPADTRRSIFIFGGTGLLWQPEENLDSGFDLLSDATGTVKGLHEVAPGELGGIAKCGSATDQDGDIAVCGWADHGSLVLAVFPGREVAESMALLRDIRQAMQSR